MQEDETLPKLRTRSRERVRMLKDGGKVSHAVVHRH